MDKSELDVLYKNYLDLLKTSEKRLSKSIKTGLERMNKAGIDTANYKKYHRQMLKQIRAESRALKNALQGETSEVLGNLQELQQKRIQSLYGRSKPDIVDLFGAFSSESGLVIANAEVDIGVRIGKHVGEFNKRAKKHLDELLKKAESSIRAGELEGLSIGEMVTDLRQNVIGLQPRKRAKGITYDMQRLVRTTGSALNYDIMDSFGRSEPSIIGVKIQRGPGPCPQNICGDGLGGRRIVIAVFIYGVNDPPSLPLHPNSYAAIVGYIFKDDKEAIQQAEKTKAATKNSKIYKAFSKGDREDGYDAVKQFVKKQRTAA